LILTIIIPVGSYLEFWQFIQLETVCVYQDTYVIVYTSDKRHKLGQKSNEFQGKFSAFNFTL
jgi:hypothetical protein